MRLNKVETYDIEDKYEIESMNRFHTVLLEPRETDSTSSVNNYVYDISSSGDVLECVIIEHPDVSKIERVKIAVYGETFVWNFVFLDQMTPI